MANTPHDPTRRLFLGGLLATGAGAALAAPPGVSLRPMPRPGFDHPAARALRAGAAERLVAAAGLSGQVGFAVADAATGEMLEVRNPLLPLPPASTAKALTALYGLDTLGAGHRFRTLLLADGPVEGGRLKGDLILAGTGDPTLDTDALGALAAALKETGIFEVTGRLRTHDAGWPDIRSIDPGQPDHLGYSPAISGLNLNFNRVHFEWKRAADGTWTTTMQARGRQYRPGVETARMEIAQRRAPVYAYSAQGGIDRWSVAEGALGRGGARWLPVRRPQAYAAETFAAVARSYGIALRQGPSLAALPDGAVLLVAHDSAPLGDILQGMLRYSTNITAECVGLASSVRRAGQAPASLAGSGRQMADWLADRAGLSKASFVDHSGLGDASRITPGEMVRALQRLGPQSGLLPLLRDLPMRTPTGEILEAHPATIRAKTGTLNFVSALAGFVDIRDGRQLTFAVFCADLDQRSGLTRAQRERPPGSRAWVRRARRLHMALIDHWSSVYA